MRIAQLKHDSLVDGPGGPRTVLWTQGCSVRCPGCQNQALWQATGGKEVDAALLGRQIAVTSRQPLTITGGEPTDQAKDVATMIRHLRLTDKEDGNRRRHIILYTGRTWDDLIERRTPALDYILSEIDILVDGPYMPDQDSDLMQWRGSANQRPILVQKSLEAGAVANSDWLVLADWDEDGQFIQIVGPHVVMTGGMARQLGLFGEEVARCGEVGR